MRRHHRRRFVHDQQQSFQRRSVLQTVATGSALVIFLVTIGFWILQKFDAGNTIRRIGTTLSVQENDKSTVSIEGGDFKRAESGQKLYPGDRVVSNAASYGTLSFFDGSTIRIDERSDLTITESFMGEKESKLTVRMQEGILWIRSPNAQAYSGSITRTVATSAMTVDIPSDTEALIGPRSIVVYSADGIGVTVKAHSSVVPVFVGEGQKFALPPGNNRTVDLYEYRSALDPLVVQLPFVESSRKIHEGNTERDTEESIEPLLEEGAPAGDVLAVLSPAEEAVVETATITVNGRVGTTVSRVRINGYNAPIENGLFSQDLALPDTDTVTIVVLALGKEGETLSEIRRKISRDRTPPPPPSITKPVASGETFQTTQERVEIVGTAPEGTVGILVNDYRLQLFEPGNRTWTYVASTKIHNYKPGKNAYKVYTINAGGYRSEPAIITIILESETPNPNPNPGNNTSLQPGSITVIAPSAGNTHTAKESSFLIEGTTSPDTASLWINSYRLRLYEAGKTTWNYIADSTMNTLQRGVNTYEIVARDAENRILDSFVYTVDFRP